MKSLLLIATILLARTSLANTRMDQAVNVELDKIETRRLEMALRLPDSKSLFSASADFGPLLECGTGNCIFTASYRENDKYVSREGSTLVVNPGEYQNPLVEHANMGEELFKAFVSEPRFFETKDRRISFTCPADAASCRIRIQLN